MRVLKEISGNFAGDDGFWSAGSKRKACANLDDDPRHKRPCLDSASCCSAGTERGVNASTLTSSYGSIGQPAPGSLCAALRQLNGERLYVRTSAWRTDLHLRILDIHFADFAVRGQKTTAKGETDDVKKISPRLEAGVQKHANVSLPHSASMLQAIGDLQAGDQREQQSAIVKIMDHCKLVKTLSNNVQLSYGGKDADRQRTNGIFTVKSGVRTLAYINLETIRTVRRRHMGVQNLRDLQLMIKKNNPVGWQIKKKLDRLRPAMEQEDPYIMGILIALAQSQRKIGQDRRKGERVYVIALPGTRAPVAYFYKAFIPTAFLNKFDNPWEAYECAGVTVSYVSISLVWPNTALRRLMKLFSRNGLLDSTKSTSID